MAKGYLEKDYLDYVARRMLHTELIDLKLFGKLSHNLHTVKLTVTLALALRPRGNPPLASFFPPPLLLQTRAS